MRAIKAISFDLDDTLWECYPAIERADQALMAFLHERCDVMKTQLTRESFYDLRASFIRRHPHLLGDVSLLRRGLLVELLQACDDHHTLAEEAYAFFYHARSQVDLYPDALPVLTALKEGYALAALTNGNADLGIIGIDHLFAEAHFATLDCPAKPEPDMFHRTCDALGIAPNELMHVGDNPETDVMGARNAGAVTVWINRTGMDWPDALEPADADITTLDELPAIVRQWGAHV